MDKIASRIWWSLTIQGALAIVFGIVALIYTSQTLLALVYIFGVFAVLSGITSLVTAVRAGEAHQRWGWLAASGLLSIAAGVVAFVWPGISVLAFVYLIATWAIVTGVFQITFAIAAPDTLAHPWLAALSGIISVLFGLVMAAMPGAGALALTWMIGIYAIISGASLLYYAYRLQAMGRALGTTGEAVQRAQTRQA